MRVLPRCWKTASRTAGEEAADAACDSRWRPHMDQMIVGLLAFQRPASPLHLVQLDCRHRRQWSPRRSRSIQARKPSRCAPLPSAVGTLRGDPACLVHLVGSPEIQLKARTIHTSGSRQGGKWRSGLPDRRHGAGFDMSHADKLFGVFKRLHAATNSRARALALRLPTALSRGTGGRIWAHGEPDKGARIQFTLPQTAPLLQRG